MIPCDAFQAADQLAADGHHVHVVADGQALCHTGHCTREEPPR